MYPALSSMEISLLILRLAEVFIFSESGGGTATLAAGKAMSVGTSGGFTTGELRIRRFTQADAATPQTLLLTGTAALVLGPTIAYNGNSDFRAPQVYS
jgi:hypothetical protein